MTTTTSRGREAPSTTRAIRERRRRARHGTMSRLLAALERIDDDPVLLCDCADDDTVDCRH